MFSWQEGRKVSWVPSKWGKGGVVVLYDEPESNKFIAAIQRLKRRRQRVARQSRLARQRVRTAIRKLRG